jgi:uncharacterized protein (TIGR03437 family)
MKTPIEGLRRPCNKDASSKLAAISSFSRLVLVALCSYALQGATYYVSPSGSDAAAGTQDQPFATIQVAVSHLNPGDTLYVRTGSYHEMVTVNQSGTAAAPITIEAYPGECPTLLGSNPVAGPWSVYKGSIYKATWPTQPQQVFVDGHLMNEARWPATAIEDLPNMTYALADDGGETYVTSSTLPNVDLTGAWVQIMAGQSWVVYTRQVAAHDRSTGKLTFASPINAMTELVPFRGNHFYVFGKLELLTSPGEWWWDPASQALYVWTPDGTSPNGRVEAGTAPAVLNLSGQSYINVNGLLARGGWFNLAGSVSCTIRNCHLRAPTWARTVDGYNIEPQHIGGIDVSGSGNRIDGGSVRLAGRSCVHLAGSGNTVRQMTLEDCGWNWANEAAITSDDSDAALIELNTVRRSAIAGIVLGSNERVLRNVVEDSCLFAEDCGILNSWSRDGKGTEVAYNILRRDRARWGAAIYLDAGSRNFNLHDNLAESILWSGANITGVNTIANNTFVDVQHVGINYVPGSDAVGADWSAGVAAHNRVGEPFPLSVNLYQPASMIPNWDWYFAYTTLAPGPRRVEIDWSDMAQGVWGRQQVPLNLSEVDAIAFQLEPIATPFSYIVSNLRLLPAGANGDSGSTIVTGATWGTQSANGATCTVSQTSSGGWNLSGSLPFGASDFLVATLPAGLTDFRAYRGLAFDLAGTASRTWAFQGYRDTDNGPDAAPGRGANLPAVVGADPANAWPPCASTEATTAQGGVVNAASFQPALAPGCLASVFGSGMADGVYSAVFNSTQGRFPAIEAGTMVLVDGVPAPLTYVSPGQINFQIPWETPAGPVSVQVARYGFATASQTVAVSAAAPSAFASAGATIMSCADGTACTLWGNGFGARNGVTRDGIAASAAPYSLSDLETVASCTLTIGGATAPVTYCGAAPGQIVDQLNFIYPSGSSATDAVLSIGNVSGSLKLPLPQCGTGAVACQP